MDSPLATARNALSRLSLKAMLRSPSTTYLVASIVGKAGSFLLIPLYTKRLSTEGYGTLGLISSLLSLAPLLFSLGLTAGFSRTYYEAPDPQTALPRVGAVAKGMAALAATFAAITASGVWFLLPDGWVGLTQRQWFLVILGGLATCLATVPDVIWRAQLKARAAAVFQLVQLGLTLSLSIFFVVVLNRGVDGALEAVTITSMVAGLVGVWFIWSELGGTNIIAATKGVLLFSLPFVPHFFGSWAQDSGDRWVLKAFGGGELGPYYLALQLLAPITLAVSAWNSSENALMGEVFRSGGLSSLQQELPSRYRRFVLVAGGAAVTVAIGAPILLLIVGKTFSATLTFLPLLVLAQVIDAAYYPSSNFIYYSGKSYLIPLITAVTASVSVLVSGLLMWGFGVWGLLGARVVSASFRSVLLAAVCRWLVKKAVAA